MKPGKLASWLLVALSLSACGESWSRPYAADEIHWHSRAARWLKPPTEARQVGADEPPPAPVLLEERVVTVTAPRSKEESRTVGVSSEERPETCFGTDQAFIARVQENDAGVRVPVWMCREGCAPGFEYVTIATSGTRRHHAGKYWYFQPSCLPVCAPRSERVSALLDAAATAAEKCIPGKDSERSAARLRREEDRRIDAVRAAWIADVEGVRGLLARCETSADPWDRVTLETWATANARLADLRGGLGAWFASAADVAPVATHHESRDEKIAKAAAKVFLERVRASLPPDAKEQIEALAERLDKMERRADQAAERAEASAALAEERARKEANARSELEAKNRCVGECTSANRACLARCAPLTRGACDSCEVERAACLPKCEGGGG